MSEARLPAHLEVAAIMRAAEAAGGFAVVLARGERDAGAILICTRERDGAMGLWERRPSLDGVRSFHPITLPVNDSHVDDYLDRRRRQDPDLWQIEVDIAQAERFVAKLGT